MAVSQRIDAVERRFDGTYWKVERVDLNALSIVRSNKAPRRQAAPRFNCTLRHGRRRQSLPVTFRAGRANLPNPEGELRPGMYARVGIGVERHAGALLIPTEALVTERAGASVFVAADGKAQKIPVTVGFNDGERVEIVKGLDAGQPVILIGKLALAPGQAVKVIETR
jgi:hypothetical protein